MPANNVPVHPTVRNWMDRGGLFNVELMRPVAGERPLPGMRQNALLRRDEWLQIDTAVLETVKTGLVGINDLIAAGLTHRVGGLGTLLSGYETVSEMTEADVSMEGDVPGEEDVVEFGENFVPIPIIHKDFRISIRKLESSRKLGESLDTTQARAATRVVREKMEAMLFNGLTKQLAGYPIYGYTNHPNRLTGTAVGDFGTAGNAYKTMVQALGDLGAEGFTGPFNVYIAQTQFNQMLNLISTSYERNEYEVITSGLPQIASLKQSFDMTDGELIFVQMDPEVVDLAIAEDITPVQWSEMGGMISRYRIMTAMAPRIKADFNSKVGILHYTGA